MYEEHYHDKIEELSTQQVAGSKNINNNSIFI